MREEERESAREHGRAMAKEVWGIQADSGAPRVQVQDSFCRCSAMREKERDRERYRESERNREADSDAARVEK